MCEKHTVVSWLIVLSYSFTLGNVLLSLDIILMHILQVKIKPRLVTQIAVTSYTSRGKYNYSIRPILQGFPDSTPWPLGNNSCDHEFSSENGIF